MAVKRIVTQTRESDLSGHDDGTVEARKFTLKLDLSQDEYDAFLAVVKPYTDAMDAVRKANGGADGEQDENTAIRQWGRDHGYDVQERGKLSASLKAAYFKAQANAGNGSAETPAGKSK